MSKVLNAISQLLTQARDAGADPTQMRELRKGFKIQFGWHPTKKSISPQKRKRLRTLQKQARRVNRASNRG